MRLTMPPRLLFALVLIAALPACGTPGPAVPGTNSPTDSQPATTIAAAPAYLSFDGSSTATVNVTANGSWQLETKQAWIEASATGGTGDASITLTIDRTGLAPGHYAGSILLKGAEPEEVITVSMRFPTLSGNASDSNGQLQATGSSVAALTAGEDYHPNQVLVTIDPPMAQIVTYGVDSAQLASQSVSSSDLERVARAVAADYNLAVEKMISPSFPVFVMSTSEDVVGVLEVLEQDGRVQRVALNHYLRPAATTDDPFLGYQWHYANINLSQAWDLNMGSPDVTVAVIDSGFSINHTDLSGNLLDGYNFYEGFASASATGEGCGFHGTHVAGTVAAIGNNGYGVAGVAPYSKVLPLAVGNNADPSCPMTIGDVISAVLYAAGIPVSGAGSLDEPVDVINMSLGGGAYSFDFAEAVALAHGNGVVIVAASGNENTVVSYPAAYPGVIAVGATDYFDTRAAYSNYGLELDIVAPGGDTSVDYNSDGYADGVLSTVWDSTSSDTFDFSQGTSMASPHVAGVAALVRSANRDLRPTEVEAILRATATDLGAAGWDQYYGSGLLNARAAVQLARDTLTASNTDLIARLSNAGRSYETRANSTGTYAFSNLVAGTYTLEVGTDADDDGILGEPGEFYGATTVTVTYTGDITRNLTVTAR